VPGAASRPNIVFILADDMGYGDFSAFNGGLSRTPTLDALMGESICLTQQFTASPVCNPSRAALMTGRYPHRTGSVDTLEWYGLERLALRETTLADVLRAAGYRTGLVGKWHLGAFDERYHPCRRGFDEAVCFCGGMHDYWQWRIEYNTDRVRRGDGTYLTDVWTDEAASFIARQNADRPFFLHVTYNAPHDPFQAPEDEIRPFAETGKFTANVSAVYAMLHRMDAGIARILQTLRDRGFERNTIVMFTSDNGPLLSGDLSRFNCNFNGMKGTVYEGGIRVPMILRWPDGCGAGRRMDDMVHFCDWFPTLLAAAGVRVPKGLKLDGINVLPVLRGEQGKVQTRRFWQWNRFTPVATCNAAMRDGDWKLVRPCIPEAMGITRQDREWLRVSMYEPEQFIENGILVDSFPPRELSNPPPPELYNIADDPDEREDLAAAEPERVARMLRELETWFEEVEAERATINDRPRGRRVENRFD